jgi:hypothetical protein
LIRLALFDKLRNKENDKMIAGKKIFLIVGILTLAGLGVLACLYLHCTDGPAGRENERTANPPAVEIAKKWSALSGKRRGKVVFARPPRMMILDLSTGIEREVPRVVTAGAAGRRLRGESPRPSWSPRGDRFVYRYDNRVYVCDEAGRRQLITNPQMDCTAETRWSWFRRGNTDWLAGPSKEGNVILVMVSRPGVVQTAYSGGDVEKHCEITGTGKYVVYDNGSDIYVTLFGSSARGIKISEGQSCRPCASPDDRAAWLPSPHTAYHIHGAATGDFLGDLKAPPGEEIYRLNWSNDPDFAVHMYGSRGNSNMNVRKVGSGDFLFIGNGWDPDLWVEPIHKDKNRSSKRKSL